jgi:hypothetical protein
VPVRSSPGLLANLVRDPHPLLLGEGRTHIELTNPVHPRVEVVDPQLPLERLLGDAGHVETSLARSPGEVVREQMFARAVHTGCTLVPRTTAGR